MTTATALTVDREIVDSFIVEVDALAMLDSRLHGRQETYLQDRLYEAIEKFEQAAFGEAPWGDDNLHGRASARVDELWRDFVASVGATMPADVIEVDFEARRLNRLPWAAQVEEAIEALDQLQERTEDLGNRISGQYRWVERQWDAERRRVGSLQRALHRERSRNYPFTDDEVLAALRLVHDAAPVRATAVAAQLYGREPTHSACVRVGLALSRLSAAGRVALGARHRADDPSAARCWAPAEVENAS